METPVVYVRLRRRVVVPPHSVVTLGSIARLVTDTPEWEQQLNRLPLHRIREVDGNMIVIDMLQVVKAVREVMPGTTVETFGEPHVLVEVAHADTFKPRWIILVLAWVLLFFGSGMALMNFHADVNMPQVQMRITELITGKPDRHPWLFQIPYSFGVGLGMLLFFNRLLRKKRLDEPNPLEVEMFMYQESVNHYIITEEYRKKHEEEAKGKGG